MISFHRHLDNQHDGIQGNDSLDTHVPQGSYAQINVTQGNATQDNDTLDNDTQINDTQDDDTQDNDTQDTEYNSSYWQNCNTHSTCTLFTESPFTLIC